MRVTAWLRFVVRVKRLIWGTMANQRQDWRDECRKIEAFVRCEANGGVERITITADDGSVVKNIYINRWEHEDWSMPTRLSNYKRFGHRKMPR